MCPLLVYTEPSLPQWLPGIALIMLRHTCLYEVGKLHETHVIAFTVIASDAERARSREPFSTVI